MGALRLGLVKIFQSFSENRTLVVQQDVYTSLKLREIKISQTGRNSA